MEAGKRQVSSTSSSFTADLFGSKEPPSSSSGIFASILSPQKTVVGSWQKQNPGNQAWNTEQGTQALCTEGANCNTPYKDKNYMFQEERAEPCHLSSSLYYGGQDIYSNSSSIRSAPGSYPIFKKDDKGEDDPNGNNSNGASRGNWWQGSLYY
ncbi:hypothetical protein LWI28_009653 [Acer negundo]|uniref:Uncharacterized protein n=1 Tax=Acer negundo TaxID=4023 RepID=A0AAD5JKD1_ACENE|nr:hypothetical protein LWI28_009653 [Acer negundo]KAK4855953.1 hypothetical protein QYF36_012680 [Acer negundo]